MTQTQPTTKTTRPQTTLERTTQLAARVCLFGVLGLMLGSSLVLQ